MNIKENVLDCCENIVQKNIGKSTVNEETLISRENGIDSLGMVTLVIDIEEKFNIDLDDYLADIRKCHTVGELIKVVSAAVDNSNI